MRNKYITFSMELEFDNGQILRFYVFKRDIRELFARTRYAKSMFRDNELST